MRAPHKPATKQRPPLPDVPAVTSEPPPPAAPPPEADDEAIRRMLEAAYT